MNTRYQKLLVLGAAICISATPALAQGRGGGGGGRATGGAAVGMGAGPMGSANAGGQSGLNGQFGGHSDARISAQGRANTNGPNAVDRDFGSDRAADRSDRTDTAVKTRGASELGGLNAAHASNNARTHASSGSRVGETATYDTQMKSALAISDPAQRNAAVTRARQQLAQTSNKPLTASAITKLDSDLKIQGAPSTLGASK